MYALYCLLQREREAQAQAAAELDADERPTSPTSTTSSGSGANGREKPPLPAIFTDAGWHVLNRSILSTSNCGNPALRLFGFGPVAADGFGLGYIVKDEGVSVCASSKHLQTRRFLDTLQSYLLDMQRMLVQLHLAANQRAEPWVDHAGVLRDAKTGRAIAGGARNGDAAFDDDEDMMRECFRCLRVGFADVGARLQRAIRSSTAARSSCSGARRTGRRSTTRGSLYPWPSTEVECAVFLRRVWGLGADLRVMC